MLVRCAGLLGSGKGSVAASLIIAAGLVYRIVLLSQDTPPTNSDEATMGLVALHISEGRQFPIFFYGQSYMGTFEAYLVAPLFWLFGASYAVLRVPALLLYLAFAVGLYALTRVVYGPWLAVVTSAVLALGSDRLIKNQLIAGGGYPEISPGVVALILLAALMALGTLKRRPAAYAVWGLIAGILFWTHWLILPYLAVAAVILVVTTRRQEPAGAWRTAALPVLAGFIIGALPLIIHNLTAPWQENSISVFLRQSGGGSAGLADRLYGGVIFGIPMGTGLCSPSDCRPWQMWWAVPYLLLLVVSAVLAIRALRRPVPAGDRVREIVRLGLVAGALLTIAAYVRSPAAAHTPVESARYLSPLLISTPAVLWPAWTLVGRLRRRTGSDTPHAGPGWRRLDVIAGSAAALLIATLVATALFATGALVAHHHTYTAEQRGQDLLATTLTERGISRIYSDYWTCNRLTFATRERVICAVIEDDLRPGFDRYLPYRDELRSAASPAYLIRTTHTEANRRVEALLAASGVPYEHTAVADYELYKPA